MRKFPSGKYGHQTLTFYPAPHRAPYRSFAALVFPWQDGQILLCDIIDRGWCIPSGRVEPDESSEEAAIREAREEAGAVLTSVQYIGCYRIKDRNDLRWADCFTATVSKLVDIEVADESRGRAFYEVERLQEVYHQWNPLIESVFAYAMEVQGRRDRNC